MPVNILMPALSPTMEKGNLAKWLKKEGDPVKTGDVIAEIETDKATMEYEAIEDGTLAKIVVPEGTNDVPVNQLIAVLAQEGEDVKAAAAAAKVAPAAKAPSAEAAPTPSQAAVSAVAQEVKPPPAAPVSPASVQTIPHFYLTVDCDIGKLLQAREEINAAEPKDKDGKPAYKLSVNDFVIKALALALQRIPDANVSWTEAGMLKHKHSDIGVAVAMPNGLITPIIRDAESKSLSIISNEIRELASRARARKLKPQEYQGGTTAISNLGMYGIKDFTAVINPPHATILAVGAGEERAVVRNGKIEAAHIMSVTMSCDHRAVDGALGAELIGAFKALIENPVMMLV
jgi:pyruvate dehydrogenase E2 component (dihydrolipoamide acetyltransferase)